MQCVRLALAARTSTGSPHSLASPRATPAMKIEMDMYSMYSTKHCYIGGITHTPRVRISRSRGRKTATMHVAYLEHAEEQCRA